MGGTEDYARFMRLLFLFVLSMTSLIFFSNLYMSIIGWDCLGVTSFLLVIFYKNRKSLGSGFITAISNRVGDCFFIVILGFSLFRDIY